MPFSWLWRASQISEPKNVRAQVIFMSKQFENQKKVFRIQINIFQKIRR
jgi:hypothetical protein